MIVVVDNRDSFTYNLVQYLCTLGAEVRVERSDTISIAALRAMGPDGVLISPGPGEPTCARINLDVVRTLGPEIPVLGVCLGHQAIGMACGARLVRAPRLMHGRTSPIHHVGEGLFRGLPSPFSAARYHSLILDADSLGDALTCTAWTDEGEVMGVRHRHWPVEGVQFHPESFLSEWGYRVLGNWLKRRVAGGKSDQEVAA